MGKHLDFYTVSMQYNMPSNGLCTAAKEEFIDEYIFKLFKPTKNDLNALYDEQLILEPNDFGFWACGLHTNNRNRGFTFTPLRQTIVLFMAAINNEL